MRTVFEFCLGDGSEKGEDVTYPLRLNFVKFKACLLNIIYIKLEDEDEGS